MSHYAIKLTPLALVLAACAACSGETDVATDSDAGAGIQTPDSAAPDSGQSASLQGKAFTLKAEDTDGGNMCDVWGCNVSVLYVAQENDDSLEVVFGGEGNARRATLMRQGSVWELTGPLTIDEPDESYTMCKSNTQLLSGAFEFGASNVKITGPYKTIHCADDYSTTSSGQALITGTIDTKAPSFRYQGGPYFPEQYPLSPIQVQVDEPLRPDAVAQMSPKGGGQAIALENVMQAEVTVGFKTDYVAAFGETYTFSTQALDLGGVGAPAPMAFTMVPDPGLLSQDGFESGSLVGVGPAAPPAPQKSFVSVITDYKGIAAPTGTRALFLDAGGTAYIHLARNEGQNRIAMDLRKIVLSGKGYWAGTCQEGFLSLTAGVIGGTQRSFVGAKLGDNPTTVDNGDGSNFQIGPVQHLTLELNDAGSDVVLLMEGENVSLSYCRTAAALIDNIHVE